MICYRSIHHDRTMNKSRSFLIHTRRTVTASCAACSFTNKNRRTDSSFENSKHEMQDYGTDLQDNEQKSQRWCDSESEESEEE